MRVLSSKKIAPVLLALLIAATLLAGGCGAGPGSGSRGSSPGTLPPGRTSPPSASPSASKFIVCGDPQNNYEVFNRVLEAARSVDFLIIAGDLTGSGTKTEFETFLQAVSGSGVKYYTVPGNHDVAATPVSQNYTAFLGAPYHSFDYGNSHFVLIDNSTPEIGFYPQEREWVKEDLKVARKKGFEHIFAVAHVPPGYPYSARATAAQIPGIDANRQLVPVLSEGGVQELFCGHVHGYLREKNDGLSITITGGAGAPLMELRGEAYNHYVLVEVDGKRYKQTVVRI